MFQDLPTSFARAVQWPRRPRSGGAPAAGSARGALAASVKVRPLVHRSSTIRAAMAPPSTTGGEGAAATNCAWPLHPSGLKRLLTGLCLSACLLSSPAWAQTAETLAPVRPAALLAAARAQVGVTKTYDPAYRQLAYPGGDVPLETGVCSDVVIRALRGQQWDLQRLLHEDMARNFSAYPAEWGLRKPDANIDHRRVLNLMTFFKRRGYTAPLTRNPEDYLPGDIVAWNLSVHLPHIGIVSDQKGESGAPKVIHNIGRGAQEEDSLFTYKIIGHYRLAPRAE